jgi:serine/threonine-protein kinase
MSNDGTHDPTIDRGRNAAAAPGDLAEGMEIGEYRVLRKVGEGGMGAVYAAIQPVIGKRVAIKVIAPHIASNPDVVRRFVDEARAVNKIGHPNIVDIFSFGWLPDRRHYFAMEFLDGKSLADRIKLGPLPPAECRRVFRQICEALEAAHRQGIVHRDLKPDNIWVAEPAHGESFAKLLDFGIAKLMGDGDAATRTQTGVMMGTPAYMSPEQCRGEGIDARTDVYALGVILYEMFARRLPFSGGFAELITHHLLTAPKPPSTYAPIPPALDALILACLEKDVAKRPQTAQELGRALEAALPTEAAGLGPAGSSLAPPPTPVVAQPAEEIVSALPDTLSPAPGRTSPELGQLPARNRRPLLFVAAAGAAAALAAILSLAGGRHREEPAVVAPPVSLPVAVPAAAPPAAGRAHVVVKGADAADVLVDGKLVAGGVREARVPTLTPGEPHRLRVEAAGRPPYERTFTVAAGAEAELEAELKATADSLAEPRPPAAHPSAHAPTERPHRNQTTASSPTSPPPAAGGKAHHRDGLVGDDIFDAPGRR